MGTPETASHLSIDPFSAPDAMIFPSGEYATVSTSPDAPRAQRPAGQVLCRGPRLTDTNERLPYNFQSRVSEGQYGNAEA